MFSVRQIVALGLTVLALIMYQLRDKVPYKTSYVPRENMTPKQRYIDDIKNKRFQTKGAYSPDEAYNRRRMAATVRNDYAESPSWVRVLVGFMSLVMIPVFIFYSSKADVLSKRVKDMCEHITNVPMFFRSVRDMLNYVDPGGDHTKLDEMASDASKLIGQFPVATNYNHVSDPTKYSNFVRPDDPSKLSDKIILESAKKTPLNQDEIITDVPNQLGSAKVNTKVEIGNLIHTSQKRSVEGIDCEVDVMNNFRLPVKEHTYIKNEHGVCECWAGYDEVCPSGEMIKQQIMLHHSGYELFLIFNCVDCYKTFSCHYNGKTMFITEFIYCLFDEKIGISQYFPNCFDLSGYPYSTMYNVVRELDEEDFDITKRVKPSNAKLMKSYFKWKADKMAKKLNYASNDLKVWPLAIPVQTDKKKFFEDFETSCLNAPKNFNFENRGILEGNVFGNQFPKIEEESKIEEKNNEVVNTMIINNEKVFQCKGNPFCKCTVSNSDSDEGDHQYKSFTRSESTSSNESWNHSSNWEDKLETMSIQEHNENLRNIENACSSLITKKSDPIDIPFAKRPTEPCTIGKPIELACNISTTGQFIRGDLRKTELFAEYKSPTWRDDRGPRPGLDLHPSKFPHKDVQYLFRQQKNHIKNLNKVMGSLYEKKLLDIKKFQGNDTVYTGEDDFFIEEVKQPNMSAIPKDDSIMVTYHKMTDYKMCAKVCFKNAVDGQIAEIVQPDTEVKAFVKFDAVFQKLTRRDIIDNKALKKVMYSKDMVSLEIKETYLDVHLDDIADTKFVFCNVGATIDYCTSDKKIYQYVTGVIMYDVAEKRAVFQRASKVGSLNLYLLWRSGLVYRGVKSSVKRAFTDQSRRLAVFDSQSPYYWKENIVKYLACAIVFALCLALIFYLYQRYCHNDNIIKESRGKNKSGRGHMRQNYNKHTKTGKERKFARSVYNAFEDYKEQLMEDARLVAENGYFYFDGEIIDYETLMGRFMLTEEFEYAKNNARIYDEEYSEDEDYDDDDNENYDYQKYLDREEQRAYDDANENFGDYGRDGAAGIIKGGKVISVRNDHGGDYSGFSTGRNYFESKPMLKHGKNVAGMFAKVCKDNAEVRRKVKELCKANATEEEFKTVVPSWIVKLKELDNAKENMLKANEPVKKSEGNDVNLKKNNKNSNSHIKNFLGYQFSAIKGAVMNCKSNKFDFGSIKSIDDKVAFYMLICEYPAEFSDAAVSDPEDVRTVFGLIQFSFQKMVTLFDCKDKRAFIDGVTYHYFNNKVIEHHLQCFSDKNKFLFNQYVWKFEESNHADHKHRDDSWCNESHGNVHKLNTKVNESIMPNSLQPLESLKVKIGQIFKDGLFFSSATRCNGGFLANKHAFYGTDGHYVDSLYTILINGSVYKIEQHQIKIIGGDLVYISVSGLPRTPTAKIVKHVDGEPVLLYTANENGSNVELVAIAGNVYNKNETVGDEDELLTNVSTKEGNCGGFYMSKNGLIGIHTAGSKNINYMINLNFYEEELKQVMPNKNFY